MLWIQVLDPLTNHCNMSQELSSMNISCIFLNRGITTLSYSAAIIYEIKITLQTEMLCMVAHFYT